MTMWRLGSIQGTIFGMIDSYVETFAKNLEDNPQIASRFMKPLINAAMKEVGGGQAGEPTIKLPVIGRVPLSLLTPFIGRFAPQVAEKAAVEAAKSLLTP